MQSVRGEWGRRRLNFGTSQIGEGSRRWRFFFQLLDVPIFDLLHEGFALEEVGLETRRELAGHDEELIVDHFRKRDGSAGGNQVCAPLKHEAGVPENEEGQDGGDCGESRSAGAEDPSKAFEENAEAENKEYCERDEKAVAVGRNACPIGVTRDEKIKKQEGSEEWSADARLAPAKENQSGNREKKDGGPDK